jgi:hypothetical protein
MMQHIENAKLRLPRSIQDLQHMRNTIICFCNSLQAIPYFTSLGNEIVVRIDDEKRGDLFVKHGTAIRRSAERRNAPQKQLARL